MPIWLRRSEMVRRRRLGLALILGAVVPIAMLSYAFLATDRDRAVQALLERDLLTFSVSWSATQRLHRNSVISYFDIAVQSDPHTLALLQAAQDPAHIDLARLHLFRHLSPIYEQLLTYGVRQFHFHRPNGESFLRFHHPARFGDDLLGVRASIRWANTQREPVFGFEVGRVVSGYRSVFPISDARGAHLGSVELSLPFSLLLEELQTLMPQGTFQLLLLAQRQRAILFEEQQSLYEAWPASEHFLLEDPHRLRPDSPPPLPAALQPLIATLAERPDVRERLHQGTEQAFRVQVAGRDYAVLQTPINDPAGEPVGLLLAYLDEPELSALDQAFQQRMLLVGGVLGLLSIALLWLLRVLDERLAERHRLQVIADTLGQGLYLTDADAQIVLMNPYGRELLGYPESVLIGGSAHELFHCHRDNAFESEATCPILTSVRAGREYRGETRFQRADGRLLDVFVVSRPLVQQGDYVGSVTLFEDIGERKQAEWALAESRRRLANILWGTGVGTWEWNVQTGETRFNQRWATMIGYRLEELEPLSIKTWERVVHPEDLAVSQTALDRHFAGETDHYEAEVRLRHRSGEWIWTLDRGRVITWTEAGRPQWMAGTHLDISAQKEVQLALQRSAHYDALTELPNRVLLTDRLEQAMVRAQRSGERLAVAFIDLDRFKPVNDRYGHAAGDQLLIILARRMRACLRGMDTLARLGGDEFVAVLCDLTYESDARVLVERLLAALSTEVELDSARVRVGGSIGLTFYPQSVEQTAEQLLQQADEAMYQAKLKGRNAWCAFEGALEG